MSDDSPLSSDEMDFIQKILGSSVHHPKPRSLSFRVDGEPNANALLARLAAHSQLSFEARFQTHRLTFPVQLMEDEFHTLHLQLGAPNILEQGPVQRPWRLHLETPVALLDDQGAESDLWVHELSPNGLLASCPSTAPKQFALWLPLPGGEPIQLRGQRVRAADQQLTAYRVSTGHREHAERMRQFIFKQHRQQHPQLQITADSR